jgi:hypothetical protein
MSIETVALSKPVSKDDKEFIGSLWDAFYENYKAYKADKMPLEDEIKYQLFSSPGPRQYKAYSDFFDLLEDGENQILSDSREYMYMHDFADVIAGTVEPAILGIMENLYNTNDYDPKDITMVSGFFWRQHIDTRKKIMEKFKKFSDRGDKVRVLTREKEKDVMGEYTSIFTENSHFYMASRIPFHYLRAGNYIFPELPHTESSIFRLSMLLDLNTLKYKEGKTKNDVLQFLDSLIEEAIYEDSFVEKV